MHIIDSAVRLACDNGRLVADDWLRQMDACGISHAVVAPADEHVAVYNREGNDQIADLVDHHPEKLTGLAVANPWFGQHAVDVLRRAFDRGLAGLYLHPTRQGFRLTEAIVDPLIEVCIELRRPIYSYVGTPICAMPFQLAELARRFPEARFVLGHFGYCDFAGYDVIPAAMQAASILVETSCAWRQIVQEAVDRLGADRLLFGSAYPRSRPELEIDKIRSLDLIPGDRQKVLCDNARTLWGISI